MTKQAFGFAFTFTKLIGRVLVSALARGALAVLIAGALAGCRR